MYDDKIDESIGSGDRLLAVAILRLLDERGALEGVRIGHRGGDEGAVFTVFWEGTDAAPFFSLDYCAPGGGPASAYEPHETMMKLCASWGCHFENSYAAAPVYGKPTPPIKLTRPEPEDFVGIPYRDAPDDPRGKDHLHWVTPTRKAEPASFVIDHEDVEKLRGIAKRLFSGNRVHEDERHWMGEVIHDILDNGMTLTDEDIERLFPGGE